MKISIIGFGFTGATLPLAEELAKENHVNCYYFVYYSNKSKSIESLDYDNERLIVGIPHKVKNDNEIYNYLNKDINLYLIPLCPNGPRWFMPFAALVNKLICISLALRLLFLKFDIFNVVLHTQLEYILYKILSIKNSVVVSVHEIYESLNGKKVLRENIRKISTHKIHVVFHSQNVLHDFESLLPNHSCLTHCIRFGNFDSYRSFLPKIPLIHSDEKRYVLFIGSIQPYKGLDLLQKAMELTCNADIPLVIAGKGYVPEIEMLAKRNNTKVLNRYISNTELVELIVNCSFVVCPYKSASQTGIIPTAFVFNKPVVATDVGAFGEMIKNGFNGILVPKNNTDALGEVIYELFHNKSKLQKMEDYLEKLNRDDWNVIADRYRILFSDIRKSFK